MTSFKEDFAQRFQSSRALRIMPHITLKIPFRLPAEKHEKLIEWFESLPLDQRPFKVEINGFGAFKRKQIIYAKPVENNKLIELQSGLVSLLKEAYPKTVDEDDRQFSPHMTIAYRDLSKEMFAKAWKEYENKTYQAEFEVNGIDLLEHNGSWSVVGHFIFKQA